MKKKDLNKLRENAKIAADMLKSIAHPTRLLILCFLTEGEKNVQELEEATGASQSMISQHLSKLRSNSIVDYRKEGNQVFYSIVHEDTVDLIHLLQEGYC